MDVNEVIARTPSDEEIALVVTRVWESYEHTDAVELGCLLDDEFRKQGYALSFAHISNLVFHTLNDD